MQRKSGKRVFWGCLIVCLLGLLLLPMDASASTSVYNGWEYTNIDFESGSITNIETDDKGRVSEFTYGSSEYEVTYENGNWVAKDQYGMTWKGDITQIAPIAADPQQKGDKVSSKEEMKAQTRTQVRLIQNRSQNLLAPKPPNQAGQQTVAKLDSLKAGRGAGLSYQLDDSGVAEGLAAGEAAAGMDKLGLGVWLSGGLSFLGNTETRTEYHGTAYVTMLGVDYMISNRTVFGVAFGVEGSYLDTDFNNVSGEQGTSGYTIAPYISIALFEPLIFDMVGGVSFLSNGSTGTPYYDSVRVMVSPNLTYYYLIENLVLSGSMGYTYAREDAWDYYNDSPDTLFELPDYNGFRFAGKPDPIETGELRVGGRAAYAFTFGQPFLDVAYIYDTLEDEEDPDEFELTVGMDFYPTDSFIVSFEAANSFFREDTYLVRLGLNLRYEF